jgi:hypothetical protein
MERQRWNSLDEFGQAVYAAALAHKSINSVCKDHCSGSVKGKVKSANAEGFTLHLVSTNLSSVSQSYLNENTKIQKVSASPYAPSSVDCRGNISVTETITNVNWSYSKYEVHTQQSTSFGIDGSGEYEGATLSGSYNQQNGKQTDSIDENSTYKEQSMTITIGPDAGIVNFYVNNYICSDDVNLDVDYDFDTINIKAVCQYKDSITGVTFNGGVHEHYNATLRLTDIGMNGAIVVSTPCLFNVNYKDEWPSWEVSQ